jgi:hypothetical protein
VKRRGLFWLIIIEDSAIIGWPHCFWVCAKIVHNGSWWNKFAYVMNQGMERKREGAGSHSLPQ